MTMTMTELLLVLHIKKMCSSVYIKKNVAIVPIVCVPNICDGHWTLKVEDECGTSFAISIQTCRFE
jgi:hypothetical protein